MRFSITIEEEKRELAKITTKDELAIWSDILSTAGLRYSVRGIYDPLTGTDDAVVRIKTPISKELFQELLDEAKRRAIELNNYNN